MKLSPIIVRLDVIANKQAIMQRMSRKRTIGGVAPIKVNGERIMMVQISHHACLSIHHLPGEGPISLQTKGRILLSANAV